MAMYTGPCISYVVTINARTATLRQEPGAQEAKMAMGGILTQWCRSCIDCDGVGDAHARRRSRRRSMSVKLTGFHVSVPGSGGY